MMTDNEETRTSTDTDATADPPVGEAIDAGGRATVPTDSRNLGVVAHLSSFVTFAGVPGFLGPLVVWLLHRERDQFVAEQARDALNFNLSLLIYAAAAVALSVVTLGLGLLLTVPAAIVGIGAWLVLSIVAAMRAAEGGRYRYPLTIELVH
jgi:uncharacterized Tic20 family protein